MKGAIYNLRMTLAFAVMTLAVKIMPASDTEAQRLGAAIDGALYRYKV